MKWGILGVNWIADRAAWALTVMPNAEVVAAASRTAANNDVFAGRYNIPRTYASCEELAADADVEAVYISTPHSFHFEHAMICLKGGKHVLCEKPFTVTREEGAELFREAQKRGLFIMEAMWTRFLPVFEKMRGVIAEGAIGDILCVQLNTGWNIDPATAADRLLNPNLAGGAMRDVGVYALTIGQMLAGKHKSLKATVIRGKTGVDARAAVSAEYENGALGSIVTAFDAYVEKGWRNRVIGTKGMITFECIWAPMEFTVQTVGENGSDGESRNYSFAFDINGFEYQGAAFEDCVKNGLAEPALATQEDTLEILGMIDEILLSDYN